MFLPAIPAYLWIWPNLSGAALEIFQSLVYLYVLAGTLVIGLRRWNLDQLGINKNGLGLSLACGLLILIGRLLIILSIDWRLSPPAISLLRLSGTLLYLFAQVGLVEELLYRGLVYRALEDWLGVRWAIWGSSIGFALWHIFGQGPLIGLATLLIGLLFALLRWRTGGIVGLIFIHALWDLETFLLVASSNQEILDAIPPAIPHPAVTLLGFAMLLLAPIYLWLIHPFAGRFLHKSAA